MPNISVIMPVYNGEKFIRETIDSVLSQSYVDFEFIIIDDGSTDNSLGYIRGYNDLRIILIQVTHGGIVNALNVAIQKSTGEYIVRIDADDVCAPLRFEKLFSYMEAHPDVAICGSWAKKINEKNETLGLFQYPPQEHSDIVTYAVLHNPFIHPSVIIRSKVLQSVGLYENFIHNEDYELWTRILRAGKGHNIPEELLNYRLHSNQITRKNNFKMRIVGVQIRVLALLRLKFKFPF